MSDGGEMIVRPRSSSTGIEIATGTTETVAVLRPADPAGVRYIGPIAVSRSGEAWAFGYPRHLSELFVVRGL